MTLCWVHKGNINYSELLSYVPLYAAPRSTRMTERTQGIMAVPFARVDTIKRSLFVRAPIHVNELMFNCTDVDMFNDSMREFRAKVSEYIQQL